MQKKVRVSELCGWCIVAVCDDRHFVLGPGTQLGGPWVGSVSSVTEPLQCHNAEGTWFSALAPGQEYVSSPCSGQEEEG